VGSQDGADYLVMECVEGETLAKRLERGALPLEQVLKYGAQIADALDKARSGVVHRDLKPGNICSRRPGQNCSISDWRSRLRSFHEKADPCQEFCLLFP